MNESYFDTTHVAPDQLRKYTAAAVRQETAVLGYFQANQAGKFTSEYVQQLLFPNAPISSIRRAFSVLTKKGLLEKTDTQVLGRYGRPNHLWQLALNPEQTTDWLDARKGRP